MAANPPLELEDQTDEDFFDKLVDDDDDDDVIGVSLKSDAGLLKQSEVFDEDRVDEFKALANLSIAEADHVDGGGSGTKVNLSVNEVGSGNVESGGGEVTTTVVASDSFCFEDGQVVEDGVLGSEAKSDSRGESIWFPSAGGEVTTTPVASESCCFEDGQVVKDGVLDSEVTLDSRGESIWSPSGGGVKVVQWSAFTDSAGHDSGGFGSFDDLFTDFGSGAVGNVHGDVNVGFGNGTIQTASTSSSYNVAEQSVDGVDVNSVQYSEDLYPGWKYDPNTGQWIQLDSSHGIVNEQVGATADNVLGNYNVGGDDQWAVSDVQMSQISNEQQTGQLEVGTGHQLITGTTQNVENHVPQQNGDYQYPAHMFFDPQYPEWYYDTNAQEWRSLDSYHASLQLTEQAPYQQENGFDTALTHGGQGINDHQFQSPSSSGDYSHHLKEQPPLQQGQNELYTASTYDGQRFKDHQFQSPSSSGDYSHPGTNAWLPENPSVGQPWDSPNASDIYNNNSQVSPQTFPDSRGHVLSYDNAGHDKYNTSWNGGIQNYPADNGNAFQQINHNPQLPPNRSPYLTTYNGNDVAAKISQPLFPNGHQAPPALSEGKSSAGRPPHALVTFGFGGKLVVMKDYSTIGVSLHGSKDADGRFVSVLNLMEVVGVNNNSSGTVGVSSYVSSLCHQSFPGPLVGGNAGSKEVNKWIDERIANCDSLNMNYNTGRTPKMLLSLLKIALQHYGRFRTPLINGPTEIDPPEPAVAGLFASVKRNTDQFHHYSSMAKCLMTLPSEAHIQTTAVEVQNLLISGKKKEALQCAREGQFWGLALVLARDLGEQFYTDTLREMAINQLVVGSPLRTLCLLIAKKPEEVFANNALPGGNVPGAVPMSSLPVQSAGHSMLDNWEENLAVITANRTENDHLVVTHLGDCLWREKNDVAAAHICYLIAESHFEPYSDTARMCLIGADHWNFPRTYASPDAIQQTELFEYASVLGNSQLALPTIQPYKLIYAHMLAEVGRVSDALKYCQAVSKSVKTVRPQEAETLKQMLSSLEERIRTHQQSGYSANLAPGKIMGKLFNFFDSTAHRVVGTLPPPAPSTTYGSVHGNGHHFHTPQNTADSQPNMGVPSLAPSASMEPISQWAVDGSKMTLQNRSISEPDIGRTPNSSDTSYEANSTGPEVKQPSSKGISRFGRFNFGSQILQKTVGLVLNPRQGRQAKLGDTNKFYYDEKLKRWVEEGAAPPTEEPALPPPPIVPAFQNEKPEHNSKNASNDEFNWTNGSPESAGVPPGGGSFGIPAIPPSSNQFSARGRMGVRSRYVDTFNKGGGGGATNLFQAPSASAAKPTSLSAPKFFIPTAAATTEQTFGTETQSTDEASESGEQESSMPKNDPFQNLAPSPAVAMQRFPSVDNIPNKGTMENGNNSLAAQSRRRASWSNIHSSTNTQASNSHLQASPVPFVPSNLSSGSLHSNRGSSVDDLQEVEL